MCVRQILFVPTNNPTIKFYFIIFEALQKINLKVSESA